MTDSLCRWGHRMLKQNIKRLQSRLGIRHVTPELLSIYIQKELQQRFLMKTTSSSQILAIFGCQRSGTSLLTRVFFRDFNVKVYRETSQLSSHDQESPGRKLRLNAFEHIQAVFAKDRAPLIVLKPLVESQRANEFLDFFPNAKGLWLYRHYKDVAKSSLQAFGMDTGIRDLRPIVMAEKNNWRSEYVPPTIRAVVQHYFSETMNPYDAAALFWYVRNHLFFELMLEHNPRILLCRYEDWVTAPSEITKQIYTFVELPYPGDHAVSEVHTESVKRGQTVSLSPEVEQLCYDLYQRLEQCYALPRTDRSNLCATTFLPSVSTMSVVEI